MRNWLRTYATNGLIVLLIVAAFYQLMLKGKSYDEMGQTILSVLLVAAGFGMLIFIHELGHFVAAKLCNVRVDAFSIGFGPPLPGCHFNYGETEYKLCWVPLGGYVKMPGEYPSETLDPEIATDPRTFMNQSVSERMFIISAGVVMNILLALVLFIYVYLAGKEELVPRVGLISPGSPAAEAGIRAGSELLEIDGNTKLSYEDVLMAAVFSTPDVTRIHFKWRTPEGETREGIVVPHKEPSDPKPVIGVRYPNGLQIPKQLKKGVGLPGTPVADAALQPGDVLRGARLPGEKEFALFKNGYSLTQAEYVYRGKSMELLVAHGSEERTVAVAPRYFPLTGFYVTMGPIVAQRDRRFVPTAAQEFRRGDVIVALDGERTFDPMRLPDLIMDAAAKPDAILDFLVKRDGREVTIKVPGKELAGYGTWDEEMPTAVKSPIGVPALGIAYAVEPRISHVASGSPAAVAGLRVGDVIDEMGSYDAEAEKNRYYSLGDYSYGSLFWQYLAETKDRKVLLKLAGRDDPVELAAGTDTTWPMPDRGFIVDWERTTVKADSVREAIWMGFRDTYRWIGRIYMSLKGLVTRDIKAEKMLQGPVGIAQNAFLLASADVNQFILYLAMFSVNLAVVNFLPIPILDGGHMVFLVVEKLRGRPASERALIIANSIGLAIIASLMLFVIFLDVSKLAFFQRFF